ncbi:hypothetical protein BKD02_06840 [Brucella sp. 09RB8910]|nr:hypothetical protein BKD02_06840 [Brucella sp. 09RB8910]
MVWREGILLLNRRNDRRGVDLHKGVSTHSEAKYTASLWDMAKNLHLGVAKPRWGNHPTFGFAPKAEGFLPIPNHKLIRHYSQRTSRKKTGLYRPFPWLWLRSSP